jgi:flagellar L-ring protein precursor FlgH
MKLPLLKGRQPGSTIDSSIDSKSSTKGEGAITRSESIELLVAAVVTGTLPNGNLVISGTQEVRVNFEVRVLTVEGIVRPRDISTENMVSYEKIAEARISYGGRGTVTDMQQPGWGQQLLDLNTPF